MINYDDSSVFNKNNKKCLTFDPFENKLEKFFIDVKDKSKEQNLRKEFYECSESCFDTFDNLPVFNYHYEISCICIKNCYENILKKI